MFRCRLLANQHHILRPDDSSPPNRKRIRRSASQQQSTMLYPHYPQQGQGPKQGPQEHQQQQQEPHPPLARRAAAAAASEAISSLVKTTMYRQRMNAEDHQVRDPVFNSASGPPGIGGGPGPQFNPGGLNCMDQGKPGIGAAGGGLGHLSLSDLTRPYNPEFTSNVSNSLEDFTGTELFRTGPDGDINFERSFGQWFIYPDDVSGVLDIKWEFVMVVWWCRCGCLSGCSPLCRLSFVPRAASWPPSPLDLRICSIDLKCCLDPVGGLSIIYFNPNFVPPCFRLDYSTFFFLPSLVFHQKKNLIPIDIEPPSLLPLLF